MGDDDVALFALTGPPGETKETNKPNKRRAPLAPPPPPQAGIFYNSYAYVKCMLWLRTAANGVGAQYGALQRGGGPAEAMQLSLRRKVMNAL